MLLLLLACSTTSAPPAVSTAPVGGSQADAAAQVEPAERFEPGPPPEPGMVDELKQWEGRTRAQVLTTFGPPDRQRDFLMGSCCHEFSIELYNTYPPNKGHDAVAIQELTWRYGGYSLTLWLHRVDGAWVVLDTCRYGDDVEF